MRTTAAHELCLAIRPICLGDAYSAPQKCYGSQPPCRHIDSNHAGKEAAAKAISTADPGGSVSCGCCARCSLGRSPGMSSYMVKVRHKHGICSSRALTQDPL